MREIKFCVWLPENKIMMRPKDIIEIQESQISGVSFLYDGEKRVDEIIFTNGSFSIGVTATLRQSTLTINENKISQIEIIGNIYQNPELLK